MHQSKLSELSLHIDCTLFRLDKPKYIFKKVYDEVTTEDIFDMSNVRIFKIIEKEKMGDIYTLLCLRSAELSKAFGIRNLCYSRISVVMLLGYRIAGISQKLESERKFKKMPCAQMLNI